MPSEELVIEARRASGRWRSPSDRAHRFGKMAIPRQCLESDDGHVLYWPVRDRYGSLWALAVTAAVNLPANRRRSNKPLVSDGPGSLAPLGSPDRGTASVVRRAGLFPEKPAGEPSLDAPSTTCIPRGAQALSAGRPPSSRGRVPWRGFARLHARPRSWSRAGPGQHARAPSSGRHRASRSCSHPSPWTNAARRHMDWSHENLTPILLEMARSGHRHHLDHHRHDPDPELPGQIAISRLGRMCVPPNVTLEFADGASLSVADGHTVTILSDGANWPVRQIFMGSGQISFTHETTTSPTKDYHSRTGGATIPQGSTPRSPPGQSSERHDDAPDAGEDLQGRFQGLQQGSGYPPGEHSQAGKSGQFSTLAYDDGGKKDAPLTTLTLEEVYACTFKGFGVTNPLRRLLPTRRKTAACRATTRNIYLKGAGGEETSQCVLRVYTVGDGDLRERQNWIGIDIDNKIDDVTGTESGANNELHKILDCYDRRKHRRPASGRLRAAPRTRQREAGEDRAHELRPMHESDRRHGRLIPGPAEHVRILRRSSTTERRETRSSR